MSKKLLLLALIFGNNLFAQINVKTLTLKTNDMVYDAFSDRIYVTIPSSNGSNGNSIGVIDPKTCNLEKTIFIGSEPSVMAISDNGQYIYVGFGGSSTVRRFNVRTLTADIQFPLGRDPFTGAFYADDIEVMPGHPETIAVSRMNAGYSPRHEGVAIYDNDVMRGITTQDHTGSNRIEFVNDSTLWGYNNETTEYGFRRLKVNIGGIAQGSVYQSLISGFYLDFIYENGFAYATNGTVVDAAKSPFVIGKFADVYGPVVYDKALNMVCYASNGSYYSSSSGIVFKRFYPNTFLEYDRLPLAKLTGAAKSVISCGGGCYAVNSADQIAVLRDPKAGMKDVLMGKPGLKVYPNPATDFVDVVLAEGVTVEKAEIVDVNGRSVFCGKPVDNRLDVSSLSKGVYIVFVTDKEGTTCKGRFVKK